MKGFDELADNSSSRQRTRANRLKTATANCQLRLPTAYCLCLLLLLAGCTNDPIPKPRGYFRIDLPAESSAPSPSVCPFTAEIPDYAKLFPGQGVAGDVDGTCWSNLVFPQQRAVVNMTWRQVHGDLPELIEDAHAFKAKHEQMATRIKTDEVLRDSARVFGSLFSVDGNVASPMVFYLTDSTSNFLYGALYFDVRPNADSLAPVTERIRADMQRFAHSLRWQNAAGAVQHAQ